MLVQDCPPPLSQSRLRRAAVLTDVHEQREAEGNHSFSSTSGGSAMYRQDAEEQRTHAARQQLVLIPKMNIERRATDLRAVEDLGDSNAVVRFLADE